MSLIHYRLENLPRFYAKTANVDFLNDRFTIKIPKSNFIFGILAVSQKTYGWSNKIIFTEGEAASSMFLACYLKD